MQISPGTEPELINFGSPTPAAGSLDVAWIHGSARAKNATEPKIQVHHYNEHTVILRQSKTLSYEAPFLFLLFGNDRALLLDTGATAEADRFPLRSVVDGLIDTWLAQHPRPAYELVVAHTHGHGDHVAADAQFADRPATTVVARELEAVQAYFGFDPQVWPAQTVSFDLGGRTLDILGSPGHHRAAITCYDPWTGLLFTGDTVLPGRLYVFDAAAYAATLDRLVSFAADHPITHVLGCHIEMTTKPGRDYPLGATYQPHEHPLQLTPADLVTIRDAARSATPKVRRFNDFILYREPGRRQMLAMMARGLANKARMAIWPG
jgi:glyoxylase-like metal-dependent hydrolase (beta-lactamase superfamily II)